MKKRVVVALGHRALGTTLPEQKEAVKKTAKVIGDLIEKGYQVFIHSPAALAPRYDMVSVHVLQVKNLSTNRAFMLLFFISPSLLRF